MNKVIREALKLVEEALQDCIEKFYAMKSTGIIGALPNQAVKASATLAAIREALAEPVQEPVASVRWGKYKTTEWTATEKLHELLGRYREGQTPLQLYAAPVDAKAIQHCPCCGSDYFAGKTRADLDTAVKSDPLYLQGRAEALEEAAKECEGTNWYDRFECAAAIRGLK